MRRTKSEAAERILRALNDVNPRGATYEELAQRTSLPIATVENSAEALQKRGKVESNRDGHGIVWISLK